MNDERANPDAPQSPNGETVDQSGQPVNVVEKDIVREHSTTDDVDKVITPVSIKEKEQDARTINERSAEVERKLNN